ncbi:MAG TPA: hypothetical protein DDW31_07185 [candidate division Zixibacteria bacterium]|jgi:hypothetical protein|nr:hypothetical protein [candidate division Zixibacteria bacterium]
MKRVAVIIPHRNGWELLERCLLTLGSSGDRDYAVYLVDNGSTDGSPARAKDKYPEIEVIAAGRNLGFAGGCNLGITSTSEEYVVLLNNDTEAEPGWLGCLVGTMDADPSIAAAQPKILWLREKGTFDYSGGAGGLLDIFGYPYCRGRLFQSLEKDRGQYDASPPDIFWASGSASIYRRSALEAAGLLDEDFFMHMEEIDLCWRLHLCGFRVVSVPGSVVYHLSGGSLPAGDFRKMYLNHRNSLLMLLKNYSPASLLWIWPARLALEALSLAKALASGDWRWARAIVAAGCWVLEHYVTIAYKRRAVQGRRRVGDRGVMRKMCRRSAALAYFLGGKRTAAELN